MEYQKNCLAKISDSCIHDLVDVRMLVQLAEERKLAITSTSKSLLDEMEKKKKKTRKIDFSITNIIYLRKQ